MSILKGNLPVILFSSVEQGRVYNDLFAGSWRFTKLRNQAGCLTEVQKISTQRAQRNGPLPNSTSAAKADSRTDRYGRAEARPYKAHQTLPHHGKNREVGERKAQRNALSIFDFLPMGRA
jgi:hypothetical protein